MPDLSGAGRTATIAVAIMALIAAQVILPATLDLITSLAAVGGGFYLGRRTAG
ncbi:hypothetical protein P7L78_22145 [Tistrella bauzanensis]|uniref:hypothetical protein n=1 Tax=Tistrella TaxID=171436 RepID=UPI0031F6F53C